MSGRPQASVHDASYAEIIEDLHFHLGYGEVWRGSPYYVARDWDGAEQEAYERGRQFAISLKRRGLQKLPLMADYCHNVPRETEKEIETAFLLGDVL